MVIFERQKILAAASYLLLLACAVQNLPGQGTAALQVTIGGLPSSVNAQVTLSGPAAYQQLLAGSATLAGLTPGVFTIAASLVPSGTGGIYIPSIYPSPSVQAVAGQTTAVTIEYEVLTPTWQAIGRP